MKKTIAFYIASLAKGGAQRVILNLSQSLRDKGYGVVLVTTYIAETEYDLPDGVERILSDITPEEETTNRVKNFHRRYQKLRNIWKDTKPDCIISFIGKNNFMAILTAFGLHIPVLTSVRGEPREEYYNTLTRVLSKTLMGLSTGLILQTKDAKAYFPKWIQKKAVILDNPLNPHFIGEYYTGPREKKIVTVGRVDENKNQKLLIDAFAKIAAEVPEYTLVIHGDGESLPALQAYVTQGDGVGRPFLNQSFQTQDFGNQNHDTNQGGDWRKRVIFTGAITDVKERLQTAKLFVLPSNTEGMPNSLMEALALGVPAVSTDCPCGGPKELMEGKENGILVPVGDVDAMAAAIKTILEDESLWETYSKNAYKLCQELHPDKVNGQWEEYILGKCH